MGDGSSKNCISEWNTTTWKMLYNFQPLLLDGDIRRESKTEKGGIFNTRPSDKKHMSYHITSKLFTNIKCMDFCHIYTSELIHFYLMLDSFLTLNNPTLLLLHTTQASWYGQWGRRQRVAASPQWMVTIDLGIWRRKGNGKMQET